MVYVQIRVHNSNMDIFQDQNTQSAQRNIAIAIDMEVTPHWMTLNQLVPPTTTVKGCMTVVATIRILSTSVPEINH